MIYFTKGYNKSVKSIEQGQKNTALDKNYRIEAVSAHRAFINVTSKNVCLFREKSPPSFTA